MVNTQYRKISIARYQQLNENIYIYIYVSRKNLKPHEVFLIQVVQAKLIA